jgi:hypothetical protein
MTAEPFGEELKAARMEYKKVAGEIFEDDKSFEMRMTSFVEWYLLDRPVKSKNRTPIKIYLDEIIPYSVEGIDHEEREFLQGLLSNRHSIFEVRRQKKEFVKIQDLFTADKYLVKEDNGHQIFRKGDVLEARIFPLKGSYLFTNAFCFHPHKAYKFIKGELKKMKKNHLSTPLLTKEGIDGRLKDFILRISYMNLKYERARGIDAKEIYR